MENLRKTKTNMENLEREPEKLQHDGTAHTFFGLIRRHVLMKINFIHFA